MDYEHVIALSKKSCEIWQHNTISHYLECQVPSAYNTLEDVPLNKDVATIYAIEVLQPDNSTIRHVGSYAEPLHYGVGCPMYLDRRWTIGIVVGQKDLWTGKIVRIDDCLAELNKSIGRGAA